MTLTPNPIAIYIKKHSIPGDTVWILDKDKRHLHIDAQRLSPTKYLYTYDHIFVDTILSSRADKMHTMLAELKRNRPLFIVPGYLDYLGDADRLNWIKKNYEHVNWIEENYAPVKDAPFSLLERNSSKK